MRSFVSSPNPWLPGKWRRAIAAAALLAMATARGQSVQNSWEGIREPRYDPANVHGAPGPAGILATVEGKIEYFTKSGGVLWGPLALETFWSRAAPAIVTQPRVIFDHESRRFFVTGMENRNSRFWLNVAVSRSEDPRTPGAADWIFYHFEGTKASAGLNEQGGLDYGGSEPGVAVDGQALYVSCNMDAFDPNGFLYTYYNDRPPDAHLFIMSKGRLIDGIGVLTPPVSIPSFGHWEPATPFGEGPGNVVYLVDTINASSLLRVIAVSDPLGSRTVHGGALHLIGVSDFGTGSSRGAPQLNSAQRISGYEPGLYVRPVKTNVSLVGGDLWICATRGYSDAPQTAAYYRLRLNGWPFSGAEVQQAEAGTVGAAGDWNFSPAIGVNHAGMVCMTWTRATPGTYPTMMCAWRNATDNGFGAAQVIKASTRAFAGSYWCGYATVWPDPADGSFWVAHEWVTGSPAVKSTWWAQIGVPASDFYVSKNGASPTELGSPAFPYHTVTKAVNASTHGTINIETGNYNESLTISRAVTLKSYNGPATIGGP